MFGLEWILACVVIIYVFLITVFLVEIEEQDPPKLRYKTRGGNWGTRPVVEIEVQDPWLLSCFALERTHSTDQWSDACHISSLDIAYYLCRGEWSCRTLSLDIVYYSCRGERSCRTSSGWVVCPKHAPAGHFSGECNLSFGCRWEVAAGAISSGAQHEGGRVFKSSVNLLCVFNLLCVLLACVCNVLEATLTNWGCSQEGVGSMTFGQHVSNWLKIIYPKSWRQKLSVGIYMSNPGGGGGSPYMVLVSLGGLQFFFVHSHGILNISSESLAQAQSIATLIEQIGWKGRLCTCPKVGGTSAPVQAAGWVKPKEQPFAPTFQDSASIRYLVECWRNGSNWGRASQLWVPGESCGHGRPYLNFCPITLRHCSVKSWWGCRWM